MAIGAPKGQGGRSSRASGFSPPMSEINVTPLVDVMLVLLVIFMVTAPMLTVSVPVDLPTGAKTSKEAQPLAITLQLDGKIFVQNDEVAMDNIVAKVTSLATDGLNQRIFLRCDKGVEYGSVLALLAVLNAAGYNKIGLVSTTDQ